jgi:oligopeptide transport system substrate-binding protein
MFICNGGNNRTGWCNEEYDRLVLDVAPRAKTDAERMAIFTQAEQMLMDDLPVLPIYTYTVKHLVHPSVKNLASNIMDQQSYRELYLEGEND